ncbi:MAG TPA: alpha-L-fucosidase [Chloroflexota bacterium]|jgi:alpha-L-fucosidase|nr:alpha-L-fucosidase [Chloroflexota bacterium]
MRRFGDGRDWFFEKRYGMFVHWGLYAIGAWHEQDQWRRGIPRADYEPLIHRFNPIEFDPERWLDVLQGAGMEYLTVTSKHHDGFCLWETQQTDFNVMRSPYGKDIVGMLADACHKRRVPLCLYYSVADWHHPNYPNQGRHHELPAPVQGDTPDWDAYVAFLVAQIRELCTNYGEIHGIWWDMNVPKHVDPSVNDMIRRLQPKAVVNNRAFDEGDFSTPERHVPAGRRFERPTEACQSVGRESWGYRADEDYYSAKYLMQSIQKIMAMGGNYLLNVGPTGDGTIPDVQVQLLNRIAQWLSNVKESFYDAEPASDLIESEDLLLTRKGDTLYVHINKDLESSAVSLRPLEVAPETATLLNTGQPVQAVAELTPRSWIEQWQAGMREERGDVPKKFLRVRDLPVDALTDEPMVVRLDFAGTLPG